MRPITNEDLESAFKRYHRAAHALGMNVEGLSLEHGSKLNGVAYRVWYVDPDGGRSQGPGTVNGYLGFTRREAFDMLHTMAHCFEDARWHTSQ